jgi:hypothetical protein
MTTTEIRAAMAGRRTVRVTYSRTTDDYRVDIYQGERVALLVATGITNETNAEGRARSTARLFGLDVTRLDVP